MEASVLIVYSGSLVFACRPPSRLCPRDLSFLRGGLRPDCVLRISRFCVEASVPMNLPLRVASVLPTDFESDPWLRKIPGERNGDPLQCSHPGSPVGRGAWQAAGHEATRRQAWLGGDAAGRPAPSWRSAAPRLRVLGACWLVSTRGCSLIAFLVVIPSFMPLYSEKMLERISVSYVC